MIFALLLFIAAEVGPVATAQEEISITIAPRATVNTSDGEAPVVETNLEEWTTEIQHPSPDTTVIIITPSTN